MLRRARFSAQNYVYHVTACTQNRANYFGTFGAARRVVHAIMREDDAGHTRTLAYVVMPDHLHWLVQVIGKRPLHLTVNVVKSFSARCINRDMYRCGPIWQKGFHDHGIRSDKNLEATARYIVANPVRAGLVKRIGDYPFWDAIWV